MKRMYDCYNINVYGDHYLYYDALPDRSNIPSVIHYIEQKIRDYQKALETCRQRDGWRDFPPRSCIKYYPTSHLDIHLVGVLEFLNQKLDKLKVEEINGQKTWV